MTGKSTVAVARATAAESVDESKVLALAVPNFEEDAGAGFEDAQASAYAIPFLQILQSGSPQVKRSEGAYIPGALEGMLLNTVTNTVFDVSDAGKPARVVAVYFRQAFVEWKLKETGGGFVAEHPVTSPLATQTTKDSKNRDILPSGNQLVDTRYHYVLLIDEAGLPTPALITMSSTQLKKSRNWMAQAANLKFPRKGPAGEPADYKYGAFAAPLYSHYYDLTTVPESNDKGSWMGWKVTLAGRVEQQHIVDSAKSFHAQIKSGAVKEAPPAPPGDASGAAGNADNAPF